MQTPTGIWNLLPYPLLPGFLWGTAGEIRARPSYASLGFPPRAQRDISRDAQAGGGDLSSPTIVFLQRVYEDKPPLPQK